MFTMLLALTLASKVEKSQGEPTPTPILSLTLIRPQDQLAEILSLFQGSRAPSPATALALWKQAKPGRGLSKVAEAGIAILNPEMVGELAALDRANIVLNSTKSGGVEWWASLPGDDGTFSALATAMVLTDGAQLSALGDQTVDRIGPPGAPVMSRTPGGKGIVLANSRESLARAPSKSAEPEVASGFVAEIDPSGLKRMLNLNLRRVGEGLIGMGCSGIHAAGGLGSEELKLSIDGRYLAPSLLGRARIDPTWLDSVPSQRLIGACAFAIDPSPEFWNSAFSLADRVEKTDPTRTGLAPLRLRLALLTAAAKLRPETELFPHLRGISGHLTGDERGSIARGLLRLHLATPDRAKALADEFVPRLATLASLGSPAVQPDGTRSWSGLQPLGTIECQAVGSSLWIGWGREALKEAREARRNLAFGGDGGSIPDRATLSQCQRFALFRPQIAPGRKSVSQVVWKGEIPEKSTEDVILWTGLKDDVHQILEQLLPAPASTPQ